VSPSAPPIISELRNSKAFKGTANHNATTTNSANPNAISVLLLFILVFILDYQ